MVYILLVGYPPFMKDTQSELFQQIRTGSWDFVDEDWVHISPEAKELVSNLLVVDPAQRWTVEQALKSAWISEPNLESMNNDLMASISSLRERRARLRATPMFDNHAVIWESADSDSPIRAGTKAEDSVGEDSVATEDTRISYVVE